MEFYLFLKIDIFLFKSVSIPNGMEFYAAKPLNCVLTEAFQFPTGWNSTRLEPERNEELKRFNSQRDGILPYQATREDLPR